MAEQRKKDKLAEQYDKANSQSKTLEEQQNEIVANYQMKEGDYKILITVYEANDLLPRAADYYLTTLDKSACDAFVEVEIRGQTKKTPVRRQTNNPIWQEPFYFTFENMSVQDLDRSKIVFNVYDKNHFIISDSHLGQFELDWTNVYFRRFHEIYRGWLTLSDPKEEIQGPVGYLLVSIAVLGPDDKIMVHDSAFIKDPLTTIEDTVTNTKVPLIDYSLNIEVYRAENLIPLDLASRSVDAYVVAKFSGNKVSSEVISSLNPEWNQALKIGTGVPNKTKYIILEVWNRNRLTGHDLIGAIKIPFIDVCEDKYINPRWGHLYGPPMCAVDDPPINYATKMQVYGQDLGSHYRGRLLFKVVGKKYIHGTNGTNKLQFKFPFKPTPVVPLKTYTLGVELIEGFQLPQRPEAVIHIGIGQYMIKSKTHKVDKRMCEFMEILQDKKVQFPQDIEQVPDIIVYFCDGREEKNRMSFIRIKASQVVTNSRHKHPHIYELDGDKSLNMLGSAQIGGYITCRVNLYANAAPQFKQIQSDYKEKTPYQLMFYLYKGENFPPANIQGDCDPFIKFNCYGLDQSSKAIEGSFNPFWKEIIPMQVSLQDVFTTNITKGIVCQAFDHEETGKHQYIGSFLITLNNQLNTKLKVPSAQGTSEIEFLYQKPKWYYVKNPHVEIGKNVFGKVLLSVALFKKDDITKNRIPPEYLGQKEIDLIPTEDKSIQVYLIGLRDIRDASKKMLSKGEAQVIMRLSELQFTSGTVQLKRSGCEINKLIDCKIKIPKNKSLTPYIDFKVLNNNSFYGFNSISLYKLLPKLKEKDGLRQRADQEDSQQTILDVQGLEKQLEMLKQKRKIDKLNHELGMKDDKLTIEELAAPAELGFIKKNEKADPNEIEFANLITVFESNYQNSPDFEYVRALEQKKDTAQKEDQKKNDQRFIKGQSSLKHLDPRYSKPAEMQENSRQSIVDQSISKARNDIKNTQNVQGEKKLTVFDKLKKKIQEKQIRQKSREQRSKEQRSKAQLSMNKSKKEQLVQKPIKEMTHNDIKIEVYDEEVLPLEKEEDFPENLSSRSGRQSQLDPQQARAREKKKTMILQANNEESLRKHHQEATNRYTIDVKNRLSKQGKTERSMQKMQEQGLDVHIEIKTDQQFSDMPVEERVINYKEVERVMQQEERDQKQARQRDEQYRFANAVKLSLFGWNRKKKKRDIETYDDYDTEQGEDLNIIPEWYKGRKILTSDFEDLNFKGTKIQTIPLFGGQKIENSIFHTKKKESAGHIKMIVMSESTEVAKEKEEYYTKLLKPKEYYCRIYILKGKSLISGYDVKPSTFLRFTYADETVSMKEKTYKKDETNPQYYICYELPLNLPGPAMVKVQVIETHNIFGKLIERVLGYTQIDLEQRYFMKRWHLYEKKPIELRNLYSQYGMGSQGRIQTFIDLIQKKKWLNTPAHPIAPPPFDKYQLRVIVWKTDDCVYKNVEMQSNDVYVRATVGTCEPQETDTHWACRSVGNFNYRMKFPIHYPQKPEDMYSDVFTVQIWDRDLVGYNNLIGEKRINLHKIHRIIEKAVKRRKPVQGKMKIKQKNYAITDRFWFDVINSKEKDQFGIPQPQGRVQLSFELVPFEQAEEQLANGFGRSQPNVYPTLQDPEGRLQFDFFSPLSFIKQIIGPKLFARWCCRLICCLAIVLLVLFGYIFLPTLLAVKI